MENNKKELERMKELAGILRDASRAYYQEDREIMSNFEYDRLYEELQELEEKDRHGAGWQPHCYSGL